MKKKTMKDLIKEIRDLETHIVPGDEYIRTDDLEKLFEKYEEQLWLEEIER